MLAIFGDINTHFLLRVATIESYAAHKLHNFACFYLRRAHFLCSSYRTAICPVRVWPSCRKTSPIPRNPSFVFPPKVPSRSSEPVTSPSLLVDQRVTVGRRVVGLLAEACRTSRVARVASAPLRRAGVAVPGVEDGPGGGARPAGPPARTAGPLRLWRRT